MRLLITIPDSDPHAHEVLSAVENLLIDLPGEWEFGREA